MAKVNVKGKYPCRANWVSVFKKGDKYIARDGVGDEEYEISANVARYLLSLDGNTHPLKVEGYEEEQCARMYNYLNRRELIRDSGSKIILGTSKIHTLFIPNKPFSKSSVFKILNAILMTSFLPVFILGLYRILCCKYSADFDLMLPGIVIGILLTMVPHELGHAIAALSYGAYVYEFGLLRMGLLPGAYVMIDEAKLKSKLYKAQINMAGIEVNVLLAGICMILISLGKDGNIWYKCSGFLFAVVFELLIGILTNIIFYKGLDGEHTLTNLLGVDCGDLESCVKANIDALFSPRRREKYFEKNGANGFAYMVVGVVWILNQTVIPIFFAAEAVEIFGGLVRWIWRFLT